MFGGGFEGLIEIPETTTARGGCRESSDEVLGFGREVWPIGLFIVDESALRALSGWCIYCGCDEDG